MVEKQVALLNELVGESLREFGERLWAQAMDADYLAADELDVTLTQIRDIELVASNTCDNVWEAEGATKEWRHMKEMMDPFRKVVGIVTELWDLTVSDPFHTQDLESFHRDRKLIYQSL